MADEQLPARPSATYQGLPCLSWRAARTPGWETDAYVVEMLAETLVGLRIEPPGRGGLYAATAAQHAGAAGGDAPAPGGEAPALIGRKLEPRGDLVMSDGVNPPVTIRGLYIRDDGIETVDAGDREDGQAVVRIHLVDLRYFWGARGELWGRHNVLRSDGTYEPRTIGGDEGEGPTVTRGTPLTLREVLELVVDRLPGRPPIVGAPASAGTITPANLEWDGILPRSEGERLCALYGLTPVLTLENGLRFTDATEKLPEQAASGVPRKLGGATLPVGAWRRTLRYAFRHAPECVRVVGPRTIREIRVDKLEPVGIPRDADTGLPDEARLVGAEEAASSYGLFMFDLRAVVLLPEHMQAEWYRKKGLPPETAAEVNRWLLRMFRLPKAARGFLPIRARRAQTELGGEPDDPDGAGPDTGLGTDEEAEAEFGIPHTGPLVEAEVFEERRLPKRLYDRLAEAAGGPGAQGGAGGSAPPAGPADPGEQGGGDASGGGAAGAEDGRNDADPELSDAGPGTDEQAPVDEEDLFA